MSPEPSSATVDFQMNRRIIRTWLGEVYETLSGPFAQNDQCGFACSSRTEISGRDSDFIAQKMQLKSKMH